MRAQLIYTLLDEEGDAVPNRSVSFTKMDGTALGQALYATESGGSPEVSHVTDSVGMLFRYVDTATRALATPLGGSARSVQFDPDPSLVLLSTDTNVVFRDGPVALDDYAGVDDYVLTIEPQTGGATGEKAFRVNSSDGTTQFEIAALGGVGAHSTDISTWARHLTVSNVRNWVDFNGVTFAFTRGMSAAAVGPYVSFVSSYQVASQPADGFGGSVTIPDDSAGSFVTFVLNTAGGGNQNADGGYRATEHELIIYPGATHETRDSQAIQAGVHVGTDIRVATLDAAFIGGVATAPYGHVSVMALSLNQTGLAGWGSTPRPANGAFVAGGNPGHTFAFGALDSSNTAVFGVHGQTGKVWSGTMVPRTTNVYTSGDSTHLWAQVWGNAVFSGNGPTVNPHTNPSMAFRGSGNYADGLFGIDAGGVVGISVASVEKGRWDANGLAVSGATRHSGAAVITPTQLAANTDNWNPTGLSTARILRASSDASRNLTGIVAQTAGTVLSIVNVGAQNIVLKHEVTSTAANRFNLPGATDLTLGTLEAVEFYYDSTVSRWLLLSGAQ